MNVEKRLYTVNRRSYSVAQHCTVDERQTAGTGVTMTLIAVVLMHVILVSPGEILTFINQHLLSRYDKLNNLHRLSERDSRLAHYFALPALA